MNGECTMSSLIYKAILSVEGHAEYFYVGQTSSTFKSRLANHKSDIKLRHRSGTALSHFIWRMKDQGKNWSIKWEKVCEAAVYNRDSKQCHLCSEEKLEILRLMQKFPNNTINKRSELLSYCHHIRREMLAYPEDPG